MPQTASVRSATLAGLDVVPVEVECAITPGMPNVTLVGVAGADAHEGVARVHCAMKARDFEMPQANVVVQVHPSTARARGAQLDLAVAAAILAATQQIPTPQEGSVFVGELALDGRVLPPRGLACYDAWCAKHDMALVCPTSTEPLSSVPVGTLDDLRALDYGRLARNSPVAPVSFGPQDLPDDISCAAERAMQRHGILLLRGADGPASHIAVALQRSLAPITQAQCDELRLIHSACRDTFAGEPPFRCPHHSITMAGMVGGGRPVMPGEVTLATHGVLLLADVELFSDSVLSTLRVALADREARIVRAEGAWHMPAAPAITIVTTRDTKTDTKRLLRALAALDVEEVFV